jgi:hypothetical protein
VTQKAGTPTSILVPLLLMFEGPIATGDAPTNVTILTLLRFLPTIRAVTGEAAVNPTSLIFCMPIELLLAGPG